MRIIKKIKKFLGLELPYLLEEENIKDPIVFKNKKENIVAIPKNIEMIFSKNENLEKNIKQLSKCMYESGITSNEARKLLNIGEMKGENKCLRQKKL